METDQIPCWAGRGDEGCVERTTLKAKQSMTLGKSRSGPRTQQAKFKSLLQDQPHDLPGIYRLHASNKNDDNAMGRRHVCFFLLGIHAPVFW